MTQSNFIQLCNLCLITVIGFLVHLTGRQWRAGDKLWQTVHNNISKLIQLNSTFQNLMIIPNQGVWHFSISRVEAALKAKASRLSD